MSKDQTSIGTLSCPILIFIQAIKNLPRTVSQKSSVSDSEDPIKFGGKVKLSDFNLEKVLGKGSFGKGKNTAYKPKQI